MSPTLDNSGIITISSDFPIVKQFTCDFPKVEDVHSKESLVACIPTILSRASLCRFDGFILVIICQYREGQFLLPEIADESLAVVLVLNAGEVTER